MVPSLRTAERGTTPMRLQLGLATAFATIAAVVGMTIAPAAPAAPPINATAPSTLNVTGTIDQATGGTFNGTLSNLQFVNQNGNLTVTGLLTGTLTNAAGTV